MKIILLFFGSNSPSFIREGMDYYKKKIENYVSLEIREIQANGQDAEAAYLEQLNTASHLVFLLSEEGQTFSSKEFAKKMQQWFNLGKKALVFAVGGAYGFSEQMKQKFQMVSLSPLTFSHHLARLVLAEQIYRALTIMHNHPYHH